MPIDTIQTYSIPGIREPVCSLSHITGAAVFAALSFLLIARGRGSWPRTISLIVLCFSSVSLLALSSVYHMLWPGLGRDVMHRIDVAGVFVMIASTITPIHVILFTGFSRWGPLVLAWSVAIAGIALRIVFFEQLPSGLGTLGFLILGWGGATSGIVLWRRNGWSFVRSLVYGGIAYTVGAIMLGIHWPIVIPGVLGPHELWHFAVLAGLGFHWAFIFQLLQWSSVCRQEHPRMQPDFSS